MAAVPRHACRMTSTNSADRAASIVLAVAGWTSSVAAYLALFRGGLGAVYRRRRVAVSRNGKMPDGRGVDGR
jgi:hypothetical protein